MIGISLKSLESDIFTRYVVFEWNIMKYFMEPDMTTANSLKGSSVHVILREKLEIIATFHCTMKMASLATMTKRIT